VGTNFSSPLLQARGVLSPYLFAVYLDELSDQLSSARLGYTVGNLTVNALMFADDRVYACLALALVDFNVL